MKNTKDFGSSLGLTRLKDDPSTPAKGMVAAISTAFNSGIMPGDVRGAYITAADGVTETLTGVELVTNGTFDVDTAGWSAGVGGDIAAVGGRLRVTRAAGNISRAIYALTCVVGKTYSLTLDRYKGTTTSAGLAVAVSSGSSSGAILVNTSGTDGKSTHTFTATQVNHWIFLECGTGVDGDYAEFDNISVREVIADRSVKNNGLVINGSLSKAPVAAGAGLCALSGFSA